MSELRWHPILEEWVVTADNRQDRTFLPPDDYCPLCPTKPGEFPTEIPDSDYDIVTFENKFPSFRIPAPKISVSQTPLYKVRPAVGICEVVCYTPEHNETLTDASLDRLHNLIKVWTDRYRILGSNDNVDYVLIFENKGKDIGVTLYHPHGQIYAFPFIPPKIQKELDSSLNYFNSNKSCLFCDIVNEELKDGRRIIAQNNNFAAFIPFFARYPYEVYILAKEHSGNLSDFTEAQQKDLANILKVVLLKYDNLWGISLPYMMIMHQTPTNGNDHSHYHFHIEFHPPHRTKNKLKYIAGCETGAGTYVNDTLAEEKAEELRCSEPDTTKDTFIIFAE